ncbi:MAG TPA: imidazole glycerol phosphate synthase subunit HisH [Alphaproteobacteria bacterium]|nr:imidazole glycerol phosphate synthase subunit HisH [Alphaproteobacteria bacterium]
MPAGTIAIIDYGSGNLRSAARAVEHAASSLGSSATVAVTRDAALVRNAARIVLPGQGAFADCMAGLSALPGMREALHTAVIEHKTPFLGICVGLQLMAAQGFEHGTHEGLGWIPGAVRRIAPSDPALKIPHMGWNTIRPFAAGQERFSHPVLSSVTPSDHFYFVHSYALECAPENPVLAVAEYGGAVAAAAGRDNMIGVQFHPEKSQTPGLRLIADFLRWSP